MYIHMYLLGRDVFHHESLRLRDRHKCKFPTFYILPQQHNNSKYFLHYCTKSQYWKKKYSHNVKVRGEKCLTGENSKRPSTIKYDTMELSLFDIVNMIFFNTDSWYNNTNNIQILGVVEVKYKIYD